MTNRRIRHKNLNLEQENHPITKQCSLERDAALYRILSENVDFGILFLDKSNTIITANPASEMIFRKTSDQLIGERCCAALNNMETTCPTCPLHKAMSSDEPSTVEFEIVKDGVAFAHLHLQVLPVRETGDVAGSILVIDDQTERRNADREKASLQKQLIQAQKMEAVGTLAGGLAHDFNNLLQASYGYAELLLLNKKDDDPGFRELQVIRETARSASELTRQLLALGKKVDFVMKPMNLNHVLKQTVTLLKRTIPRMIDIDLELDNNLRLVNGDPMQLEQVIMNLVVNAKDAISENGKVLLQTKNVHLDKEFCRTHLGLLPGNYVLFIISDNGRGMAKETIDHIFDPFYTTKEAGKGTGLGLTIVYGIVKNHGGCITCYSSTGMGTTFKIYLPAMAVHQTISRNHEIRETPKRGSETILIVEDEESIRDLTKQSLEKFGYKVFEAGKGESALEIYREKSGEIDLVLMDLIMPGMGGKKCVEELLRMNPGIKVIMTSGFSENGSMMDTLKASTCGFISKPYGINQLLSIVREFLDRP